MSVLLTDDLKWYGVGLFVMWQKTVQLMDGLVFPNPKEALRSQDFYTHSPFELIVRISMNPVTHKKLNL